MIEIKVAECSADLNESTSHLEQRSEVSARWDTIHSDIDYTEVVQVKVALAKVFMKAFKDRHTSIVKIREEVLLLDYKTVEQTNDLNNQNTQSTKIA